MPRGCPAVCDKNTLAVTVSIDALLCVPGCTCATTLKVDPAKTTLAEVLLQALRSSVGMLDLRLVQALMANDATQIAEPSSRSSAGREESKSGAPEVDSDAVEDRGDVLSALSQLLLVVTGQDQGYVREYSRTITEPVSRRNGAARCVSLPLQVIELLGQVTDASCAQLRRSVARRASPPHHRGW
jgi:hypothetical protein